MDDLFSTIATAYSGSALAAALTGSIWAGGAPQNPSFPYGAVNIVSNVPEGTANDSAIHKERLLVQIDLYSSRESTYRDSPGEIDGLYNNLLTLLENKRLASATHVYIFSRAMSRLLKEDDCWHYSVEFFIQRHEI